MEQRVQLMEHLLQEQVVAVVLQKTQRLELVDQVVEEMAQQFNLLQEQMEQLTLVVAVGEVALMLVEMAVLVLSFYDINFNS